MPGPSGILSCLAVHMLMGIMGHLGSLHGRHCRLSAARPID
jgi:hypothetical protein